VYRDLVKEFEDIPASSGNLQRLAHMGLQQYMDSYTDGSSLIDRNRYWTQFIDLLAKTRQVMLDNAIDTAVDKIV